MKKVLVLLFFLLLPLSAFAQISTQEEMQTNTHYLRAEVVDILEEDLEADNPYQRVVIQIVTPGDFETNTYTVDSREGYIANLRHPVEFRQIVQVSVVDQGDQTIAFITDVFRFQPLMVLVLLFVAVLLAVGFLRGISAILGLIITFAILFFFILPQLLAGHNPLLITIIGSAAILAGSIYSTHGTRKQSTIALVATLFGLVITGILAQLFTDITMLTGLASEEAALLQLESGMSINLHGIMLAGMILGAVGVLDDVAVTQTETVFELKDTDHTLTRKDLFKRGMRIGRHHIASVVNTLVLAYVGAGLPLLLLFLISDQGWFTLINSEFIAEEIVRTLVGTIGLVLTVPLATWFAAVYAKEK